MGLHQILHKPIITVSGICVTFYCFIGLRSLFTAHIYSTKRLYQAFVIVWFRSSVWSHYMQISRTCSINGMFGMLSRCNWCIDLLCIKYITHRFLQLVVNLFLSHNNGLCEVSVPPAATRGQITSEHLRLVCFMMVYVLQI